MYFPAGCVLLEKQPVENLKEVCPEGNIMTSSSPSLSPLLAFDPAVAAPTSFLPMQAPLSIEASSFEKLPRNHRDTPWVIPNSTTLHSVQPLRISASASLSALGVPTPSITTPPSIPQSLSGLYSGVPLVCPQLSYPACKEPEKGRQGAVISPS